MNPYDKDPEKVLQVVAVATRMRESGLCIDFVAQATVMALEFEGTFDLMMLWDESDTNEKDEIVADIQDEIDSWLEAPTKPVEATKINFNELNDNVEAVVAFKKALRHIVDSWGGIF